MPARKASGTSGGRRRSPASRRRAVRSWSSICRRCSLDSHTLYQALDDRPELSGQARDLIVSESTDVFVSPISFHELMFEENRRRLERTMPRVAEMARAAGFKIAPPRESDWKEAALQDWAHGDPFDRLLLAQAAPGFEVACAIERHSV